MGVSGAVGGVQDGSYEERQPPITARAHHTGRADTFLIWSSCGSKHPQPAVGTTRTLVSRPLLILSNFI